MSIAAQLQTIARREYALLRTCAKALDQRLDPLVAGSPGLSAARSRVREVLQNFDGLVSGAPTPDAGHQPRPAGTAPETGTAREDDVARDSESEHGSSVDHPDDVERDEVEHLAEELLEEEDDHHVGELADNEDLRDVQARLRAKHSLQEFNEQQS